MNLNYFVEEFAKAVQSENIKSEHEGVMSVQMGDFELFFAHLEHRNVIMLHTSLAEHDESKETLANLLVMNNFFAQTHGVCLGIDGKIITAQQNIFVSNDENNPLTLEQFMEQCELFLLALPHIMEQLKKISDLSQSKDKQSVNLLNPTSLV